MMKITRRSGLQRLSILSLAPLLSRVASAEEESIHLATNTYPWRTFAKRSGEKMVAHSEKLLAQIAACGLSGYEPIVNAPSEFEGLAERLDRHGLEMRSLYVNSTLHDRKQSE